MKRTALLPFALVMTLVLAACGGGGAAANGGMMAEPAPAPMPAEPEHVDPTGEYEIAIEIQGQAVDGIMVIEGSMEDGYFGEVETAMGGAAITVEVDGNEVVLTAADVGVEIFCVMDEEGVLEGEVTGAMGSGSFFAAPIEG